MLLAMVRGSEKESVREHVNQGVRACVCVCMGVIAVLCVCVSANNTQPVVGLGNEAPASLDCDALLCTHIMHFIHIASPQCVLLFLIS